MGHDNNGKYEKLMELTKGDYKAFLYDCDGTLADNMEDHKETYERVASDGGVEIDPGIVDELAGYPTTEVVAEINKRYKSDFNPKEFDASKSELFYNEFIPQTKPITHVVDHLKASAGKYKIAVVSGSSRKTIKKTLEVLGIDSLVDLMVCSEDYEKGKPNPEPFLMAAEKLGVEPEACIVFEDGDPGVQAAEAAGMKSIRIDKV
ncbi:HAD family hydrolase [Segetibacter aerophilus]|uniref:Fructose-1-phosphate/6-phosphogluconate phosphatase n=1 Tax=Segetibacter aerophilus TaxID=670293 RepID=A0A512BDG3_9BACT|nr:HAD-IA family hydrolase [Segetibacter aerophilus]GEO09996.1 fructose-1-phosphate/6-phosphogluconate phosphatase [Segetibacter aerophilus]